MESCCCCSKYLFKCCMYSIIINYKQRLGSSTLCTVAVGSNNKVYYYNIGDSGLYVFRYGIPPPNPESDTSTPSSTKEWLIQDYSPKQCHSFNFPFQLGKGADNV